MEVQVDTDGELVDAAGLELKYLDYLKASGLLDHLIATRTELIISLLAVLEAPLQTAINASKTSKISPFCRSTAVSALRADSVRYKARADCTAAILGSLIQSLAAEDLFPYPESPEDILESAGALKQRLIRVVEGIETLGVPGVGGKASMGEEAHAGCNPKEKLLRLLDDVLIKWKRFRCMPTVAQQIHLQSVAQRRGLSETLRRP